ncbi:hypothetical protein MRX96_024577 [Rhipicephalus microplus]
MRGAPWAYCVDVLLAKRRTEGNETRREKKGGGEHTWETGPNGDIVVRGCPFVGVITTPPPRQRRRPEPVQRSRSVRRPQSACWRLGQPSQYAAAELHCLCAQDAVTGPKKRVANAIRSPRAPTARRFEGERSDWKAPVMGEARAAHYRDKQAMTGSIEDS